MPTLPTYLVEGESGGVSDASNSAINLRLKKNTIITHNPDNANYTSFQSLYTNIYYMYNHCNSPKL